MKFTNLDHLDILKLVGCPCCERGDGFREESNFIYILSTESNLSLAIPEKLTVWANCKYCNNVSYISYWNNSENPRIKVTQLCSLEEYIEYLNKEYERIKEHCMWYPFKVEDYINK